MQIFALNKDKGSPQTPAPPFIVAKSNRLQVRQIPVPPPSTSTIQPLTIQPPAIPPPAPKTTAPTAKKESFVELPVPVLVTAEVNNDRPKQPIVLNTKIKPPYKTDRFLSQLGIKAYTCTWPECEYAACRRDSTIAHIRRVHFQQPYNQKEPPSTPVVLDSRDPNDYVHIDAPLVDQVKQIKIGLAHGEPYYRCKWADCRHESAQFDAINSHVRGDHLHLPMGDDPTREEYNEAREFINEVERHQLLNGCLIETHIKMLRIANSLHWYKCH